MKLKNRNEIIGERPLERTFSLMTQIPLPRLVKLISAQIYVLLLHLSWNARLKVKGSSELKRLDSMGQKTSLPEKEGKLFQFNNLVPTLHYIWFA